MNADEETAEERPEKIYGFLTDIKRRIRTNRNAIILICGETGSGKSYSALRIAEQLDEDFNITRCVFSAEDFMELISKGNLKRGTVILWDECGIELDARNFWSISNKLISYTLESFRYLNLVLILTVPSLSFVDSKLRKLVHYVIETQRIDFKNNRVLAKVLIIQHSPRSQSQKVYQKFIIAKGVKLKKTFIGRPSDKITTDYEDKKKIVLSEMYNDINMELKNIKGKERNKKIGTDDIIDKVTKDIKTYIREWRGRKIIDEYLIASNFKIALENARKVKRKVEQSLLN